MTTDDLVKHLDLVNKVASEYLKGLDASEISNALAIPRPRVMALLNDWRVMASNNQAIHARAKEALAGADQHFSSLIKKAYEVIDAADSTANLTAKTTSIKLIADIETKRLEMLQKAGLLDNKEIAEQIIEMERKHDILIKILKDIASSHPEIREEIMKRLSEIQTEVIVIDND
jgi:sugar-specific transcriptional regulator TrmB